MDKRYDHLHEEHVAQQLWEHQSTYTFAPTQGQEIFSIDTPPPTVSGTLHIGHIYSYTQTDFVARYKRMLGQAVFYPMGFDDNGLPTERYVEKLNNVSGHRMKRSEFIALCLQATEKVEKTFENLWRRMGLSIDWQKIYSTISPKTQKISQHSFIELYKNGHVYRKHEPSLYCTTCRTSVAQAELDSSELPSTFNDVAFTTTDGQQLVIATTRPELLPACVAVFYHPSDTRYQGLQGKHAVTPIFNKMVPILADEQVNPEKGTGLVMCCTFGDQLDIAWYKKHNLPCIPLIGHDGAWSADGGILAGLKVQQARKKVLEVLQAEGKLLAQKPLLHHVHVHERCKQEIEYLTLTQWFVRILENKQTFLDLADQIEWKPESMKARYRDWVQNLNYDWCISRQRFFGIPFPAWHCTSCQHVILPDEKDLPLDPQETPYSGGSCSQCKATTIVPDNDVMDTWNTSSLTPQINLNWPEMQSSGIPFPMSMRPQAHDIIRTWAFDTIVKSWYHHNTIPWKLIMISGHVLAGKEKISKSKENEKTSPESLLNTYPADVIRFWAAKGKLGIDTAFSENQLKIGQKLVTKLWNAFLFCEHHLNEYQPIMAGKQDIISPLNQWLLTALSETCKNYQRHFEGYEYSHALDAIDSFFWNQFCDNYLELIKDQLFNPSSYDEQTIQETRCTLYQAGFGILQLYAPFLPHVTETIYQKLFKQHENSPSIHVTRLMIERYTYSHEGGVCLVEQLLQLVDAIRKLKSEHKLSLKTELRELVVYVPSAVICEQLHTQMRLITGITKANQLTLHEGSSAQTMLQETDGTWHAIVQL